MKYNEVKRVCKAGLAAIACVATLQAVPITGQIAFSGATTLNAPIGTAIAFVSWDNVVVQNGTQTGAYVGLDGTSVARPSFQFDPLLPDPFTIWSFSSAGINYSFELSSPININRFMLGATQFLVLEGRGIAYVDGYDPTPAEWSLTTQGTGGVNYSFSSFMFTTPVPDGGVSVLLLGLGFLGLAWMSRKQ